VCPLLPPRRRQTLTAAFTPPAATRQQPSSTLGSSSLRPHGPHPAYTPQLKEAQELLVEKERLASLGALMASIAHEIKNPLNFVNNFAQLSAGFVKELREELKEQPSGQGGSSLQRMDEVLSWLEQNVGKIEEHGKRADSILRTMQLHSHVRANERVLTDLNALVQEQLSLVSQSLRKQVGPGSLPR
jgi:signal transduction histidine kinase